MSNKICAIVGVGPGVGLAVAKRFGKEGFRLALLARRAEALDKYVAELDRGGLEAAAFPADAANFDSLKKALAQVKAQLGSPDVLVYNPAVMVDGKPSTLDAEELMADFRVNVGGALVCAQQVIPDMKARGSGTLLFTGGGLALHPHPQYTSLAIGKAGLWNLTHSLAAELESDGIHVATITIAGSVKPGTYFDPDLIAEKYWELHAQAAGAWEQEIVYKADS